MMGEPLGYRHERIERLLQELKYEVTRGMMEREIDEQIGFRFVVPLSRHIPNGVVFCEFHTRPVPALEMVGFGNNILAPRLRVIQTPSVDGEKGGERDAG